MVDPKQFGKYLKELRRGRTLTTRQVEIYSGVSNSYLSLLERGKRKIPSPEILKKLSPVYRVPYEELMTMAGYLSPDPSRTNDPTPPNTRAPHKPSFEISEEEIVHLEKRRKLTEQRRRISDTLIDQLGGEDEQAAAKG